MSQKNQLPSKGRDIPIQDKIEIAARVCELYATNQYTLASCLTKEGIQSDSVWYRWCQDIEEIEDLYNNAKAERQSNYHASLVSRASTALEKHLDGWTTEVTERWGEPDKRNPEKIITTQIKEKQIYHRPSLQAAIFVLTNLKGETYTRNPEPYKAGNEKIPTKVQFEILGGQMPPVTNEHDIRDIQNTTSQHR